MAKSNLSASIAGIEDIRKLISPEKLTKGYYRGVADAVNRLNSALSFEVTKRYNVRPNALETVRIGKSTSNITTGKNFIAGTLQYKYKPVNLARFATDITDPGRIGSWFYATQNVSIVRGRNVPSRGSYRQGGFIPRHGYSSKTPGEKSKQSYYAKKGYLMWEREEEDARLPITQIFGPSLTDMAEYVFDQRLGKIGELFTNLEDVVFKGLDL